MLYVPQRNTNKIKLHHKTLLRTQWHTHTHFSYNLTVLTHIEKKTENILLYCWITFIELFSFTYVIAFVSYLVPFAIEICTIVIVLHNKKFDSLLIHGHHDIRRRLGFHILFILHHKYCCVRLFSELDGFIITWINMDFW